MSLNVANRSVGWVEQGDTQHTQQSFFYQLDDVYVGSVARYENRVACQRQSYFVFLTGFVKIKYLGCWWGWAGLDGG